MHAVAKIGSSGLEEKGTDPFGGILLLQVMETNQPCLFGCVESGFSTVRGMLQHPILVKEPPPARLERAKMSSMRPPFWGHHAGLSILQV